MSKPRHGNKALPGPPLDKDLERAGEPPLEGGDARPPADDPAGTDLGPPAGEVGGEPGTEGNE